MIMQIDVEGRGPTLVLVHSLLTDSHAFDDVVPELAKNHRVVRISCPGCGTIPQLDIFAPTSDGPWPVVVAFHGLGARSDSTTSKVAAEAAAQG